MTNSLIPELSKKTAAKFFIFHRKCREKAEHISAFLENDGVMLGDRQDDITVSYGTFIPQKSGRCIIYAVDYFAIDVIDERLYDVTVDENLKISYVQRDAYKFFRLNAYLLRIAK